MHPDNATTWKRLDEYDEAAPAPPALIGDGECYRIVTTDRELHAIHVMWEALTRHCPSRAAKLRALRWAIAKAEETP